MIANAPIAPPIAIEPVSPMMHLGGEGVVPEESDRASDQRRAEDRHVQGGQVLLGLELPRPV